MSDRATCPTCGGESMLRGRCVLPWCSSYRDADSEPSVPVSSASGASGVVADGSEAESATEAIERRYPHLRQLGELQRALQPPERNEGR